MKQIGLILFLIVLGSVSLAYANANLPKPQVIKINEHVYALLGPRELPSKHNHGYMVNSTVIIGDKGAILVDTGFTNEIGQLLKQTIKTITDKPVTHVINTHHHGDHTLGNSEFKGAEIISAQKCKELLEKTGYEWIGLVESMTGEKFPDTKPVPATVTYEENTHNTITLQGVKMELWVPQGSHTPGDLMVYLPNDKILISGDILVNKIMPNFRDGHIKNWVATLHQISTMDLATIVPGHGPLMTVADVKAMHSRMAALYAGVEAGYKKGLIDSEVRKTMDLSDWRKLDHFDETMGGNINRTYLEVEAANF
jgi:cyclase